MGEQLDRQTGIPNHSNTYRPRSVSNTQSQICIICLLILSVLHVMNDFGQFCYDIWCQTLNRESAKGRETACLLDLPCLSGCGIRDEGIGQKWPALRLPSSLESIA